MPSLTDLLTALHPVVSILPEYAALDITRITADSRQVQPGALFVAIAGGKHDGTAFIDDAVKKGAVAVVSSLPVVKGGECPTVCIFHPNPRLALSRLASAFYPRQPVHIAAVTGTDGKTSTAEFTRQLWELLGYKAASVGTLGVKGQGGKELYPGTHTTPDPVSLHKMLQELADAGYTHLAMEASSHGLDQYRLHGVRISAAAFTNLTRDHLDYHGNEEAYFAAKAKLFTEVLPAGGTAVVNVDDRCAPALLDIARQKMQSLVVFGQSAEHMGHTNSEEQRFFIQNHTPLPDGQCVVVHATAERKSYLWDWFSPGRARAFEFNVSLVGVFQLFNMLAALGILYGCGEKNIEKIINLLPSLKGVPGRLEHIADVPNGAAVYIDYAHTPAALANVLNTLRPHVKNRLLVVFGCGGDRDKGKRPLMGKAAAEYADMVFVTDDNPRSEDAGVIRAEVLKGAPDAKEIAGREAAIRTAMEALQSGDVLLVAGKGHENTQTIGTHVLPFNDADVICVLMKEMKG